MLKWSAALLLLARAAQAQVPCTGLELPYATVAGPSPTHWCVDPVDGAETYKWEVSWADGVEVLVTPEAQLDLPSRLGVEFSVRARACAGALCGPWSQSSGRVLVLGYFDSNGDGTIGAPDFSRFREVFGLCLEGRLYGPCP